MNAPFELHVALRYLFARRKQAFISVISLISTLGVILGVMALVIALALMTGLQQELRDRILGSTAHVYVWKYGGIKDYEAEAAKLRKMPQVVGAAPAIEGKALATSAGGEAFISIKGIDPALETQVTDIGHAIKSGSLAALSNRTTDELPGIVLGVDLARSLKVSVGDEVTVMTAEGTLSPMGMLPRQRVVRVVATFGLGLYEYDSTYGMVTLPIAERLLDKSDVEMIELRVADIYRAPEVAANIQRTLGSSYVTEDWGDMNKSLFSALWLEKMAMAITIGLIVMVAALNIVASLVLLVMEKHADIAILKTMGASSRSIMTIFMLQGLLIGVAGTLIGAVAGYVVSHVADRYHLVHIPSDVYQISYMPFRLQHLDLAVVVAAAIVICFLATIYPSRQAAKLDPAEALRYG